jgi:Zn-dependent peptidase ImmA (M78 family)/transcriptional regulator with XRE-family HTH domain
MLGKNITYYRLKQGMSKKELAQAIGVTAMTITHYEQNQRTPNLETSRKLAAALNTNLAGLMATPNGQHKYAHCEYRKQSRLSKTHQDYICASVEEYFDRFLTVSDILGAGALREAPLIHSLKPTLNAEEDARNLRAQLGFALEGPIPNLVGALENKGILVFLFKYDNDFFSGMNGLVDNRPYIIINKQMTPERQRSTLVHELGHIFFENPEKDDSSWEKYMTAVSGAFLFPKEDAYSELGLHRSMVTSDMAMVAKEYGISLQMLAKRAQVLGILDNQAYKMFNIRLNQNGGRKNEPSRIDQENTSLFEQLVLRAIGEEEITVSKGAELLKIPLSDMRHMTMLQEEC